MLELEHVAKIFANANLPIEAIRDISLTVVDREFLAFVGPSGCGKTTLLRLIAGLEKPTGGRILFGGQSVLSTSRERGMVFQDFALFPWLTVEQNIGFGLRVRGVSEDQIRTVVSHYLEVTGLRQFRSNYPYTLSGGMQQRVAICRTLANDPKILLLDEPFGALDVQTRAQLQEFLADLWEEEHKTVVLVTHDIEEALFLADRICILSSRPATVMSVVTVGFGRPRRRALKMAEEFFQMKKVIVSLL